VNLRDLALHRELAALVLELPRGLHQLALVDLPLDLRRIQQRRRRQREGAVAAGGGLDGRGVGERERRRHFRRLSRHDGRRRLQRRGGLRRAVRFLLRTRLHHQARPGARFGVFRRHLSARALLPPPLDPAAQPPGAPRRQVA
jgi:hypothetical protein